MADRAAKSACEKNEIAISDGRLISEIYQNI